MLCYSVIVTGLEVGRRIQPFANSFFDVLDSTLSWRLKNAKRSDKSKLT